MTSESKIIEFKLEIFCRNGSECPNALSGKCYYNHYHNINTINIRELTNFKMICRNDKPYEGIRCNHINCKFDHFHDHIRNIKMLKFRSSSQEKIDKITSQAIHTIQKIQSETSIKSRSKSDNIIDIILKKIIKANDNIISASQKMDTLTYSDDESDHRILNYQSIISEGLSEIKNILKRIIDATIEMNVIQNQIHQEIQSIIKAKLASMASSSACSASSSACSVSSSASSASSSAIIKCKRVISPKIRKIKITSGKSKRFMKQKQELATMATIAASPELSRKFIEQEQERGKVRMAIIAASPELSRKFIEQEREREFMEQKQEREKVRIPAIAAISRMRDGSRI